MLSLCNYQKYNILDIRVVKVSMHSLHECINTVNIIVFLLGSVCYSTNM